MSENDNNQLLNYLLQKGVTPSFSFPLDCAIFEVKGITPGKGKRWENKIWASTGQDLRVALSIFSPKKVIMINKVEYEIGGLYFPMSPAIVNKECDYAKHILGEENCDKNLKWYNFCDNEGCGWVHRDTSKECIIEECPVCQESEYIRSKRFVQPEGFAPIIVPWSKDGKPRDGRSNKITSTAPRMKAKKPSKERDTDAVGRVDLPAPLLDESEEGLEKIDKLSQMKDFPFKDRLEMRGSTLGGLDSGIEMIQVNTGFQGGGYFICQKCGRIEPGSVNSFDDQHHRPYAINLPFSAGEDQKKQAKEGCKGEPVGGPIGAGAESLFLGMTFRSDIVTFRFKLDEPLEESFHLIVSREFNSALVAIKEALITEVQSFFKYVNREIGGGIRKFAIKNDDGDNDYFVEIFLFDQVSGGAGLVTEMTNNVEALPRIFSNIEHRLSGLECTNGKGCDKACVGCLLDFRNSREHSIIDRIQGMRLFRFLKTGKVPIADWANHDEEQNNPTSQIEKLALSLNRIDERVDVDCVTNNGYGELRIQVENREFKLRPTSSLAKKEFDPIASGYRPWARSNASEHKLTFRKYEVIEREQIDIVSTYARLATPSLDDLV